MKWIAAAGLIALAASGVHAQDTALRVRVSLQQELRVGREAPALVLPYATSDSIGPAAQPFDLRKELGRTVLLVFYGHDTSATARADWSDLLRQVGPPNAEFVIAGISADPLTQHVAFARSATLPVKLLYDRGSGEARRLGAVRDRRGGITTVAVIGRDGRVRVVVPAFAPADSARYVTLRSALDSGGGH